jgi:hypothetical protein
MMTVLMIERHMLQMMLYNMLCNLLCNHSKLYSYHGMLHNTVTFRVYKTHLHYMTLHVVQPAMTAIQH